MFGKSKSPVEKPQLPVNQKNLDYHKERVLKTFPEASCFEANMFWPGQGSRKSWIVTRRPIDSMPFTTAQTEEWAWERAAVNIAFGEATKALRAVQDWVDSTNPDVPWKLMVKDALDITKP